MTTPGLLGICTQLYAVRAPQVEVNNLDDDSKAKLEDFLEARRQRKDMGVS